MMPATQLFEDAWTRAGSAAAGDDPTRDFDSLDDFFDLFLKWLTENEDARGIARSYIRELGAPPWLATVIVAFLPSALRWTGSGVLAGARSAGGFMIESTELGRKIRARVIRTFRFLREKSEFRNQLKSLAIGETETLSINVTDTHDAEKLFQLVMIDRAAKIQSAVEEVRELMAATQDAVDVLLKSAGRWNEGRIEKSYFRPRRREPTAEGFARFKYYNEVDAFVGRTDVFTELTREFLNPAAASQSSFRWRYLYGGAGSGKSRLCHEIMRRFRTVWPLHGFLAPDMLDHMFDDHWRPGAPTLLVADYATERADDLVRLMCHLAFAQGDFQHPVRMLVVTRKQADPIVAKIHSAHTGEKPLNEYRASAINLDRSGASPSGVTDGLTDADLLSIMTARFRTVCAGCADVRLPGDEIFLQSLRDVDDARTPLMAALVGEELGHRATEAGGAPVAGRLTRTEFLGKVLEREEQRWSRVVSKLPNAGSLHIHKAVLATSTFARGNATLPQCVRKDSGVGDFRLPRSDAEFDEHLYRLMVGRWHAAEGEEAMLDEATQLGSLEPDLLGEYFLLSIARTRRNRLGHIKEHALRAAPWSAGLFVTLCYQDFPDELHDPTVLLPDLSTSMDPRIAPPTARAVMALSELARHWASGSTAPPRIELSRLFNLDEARHMGSKP